MALTLNKKWKDALLKGDFYWRFLCECIARERLLYVRCIPREANAARALFLDLWAVRSKFVSSGPDSAVVAESVPRFSVSVAARFKPPTMEDSGESERVPLPLHQALPLLRERAKRRPRDPWAAAVVDQEDDQEDEGGAASNCPDGPAAAKCTPESSPKMDSPKPAAETDTESTDEPVAESSGTPEEEDDIAQGLRTGVLSVDEKHGSVVAVAPILGLCRFNFDNVFGTKSSQSSVYEATARPLVQDFLNGRNATVLVYGQTGSGKTHTMFGTGRQEGIIPRAIREVLAAVAWRREKGLETTLSMSYVEVYGNQVNDLLRHGAPVGQSRVAGQRYVLDGSAEVEVTNAAHAGQLLEAGEKEKRQAATAMNERSSRAHAVVTLRLTTTRTSDGDAVMSRLVLADLGGCEKIVKSKADEGGTAAAGTVGWAEYYAQRLRLREAALINVGLFALKKCIDALNAESRMPPDVPRPYVPYQDSKLTMLLSPALGGDAKLGVVLAAATEASHATETVQALRFGERCANVDLADRGVATSAKLLADLQRIDSEMEEVELRIKQDERWENVIIMRPDLDGEERITKSVLVGAEKWHARMEQLAEQRAALVDAC